MRRVVAAVLCLGLAACDTPNFRTSQFQFGASKTLAATGNLRFVTERSRPLPYGRSTVVCTEPTPDYATDSGTDAKTTVKAQTPSPVTEAELGVKTTETTRELSGRSKGVLALRDGLYAACQAYANGLLGKDAYSVILSQYGFLLVALMRDDTYAKDGQAAPTASGGPVSSAFAAMLVACINNADPTRKGEVDPRIPGNPLLTSAICKTALQRAASGRAG